MHIPTVEEAAIIEAALHYEPHTGILYWKDRRKRRGSNVAGTIGADGYCRVMLNYRMYSAVRLCWFLYYKEWPASMIDHIDRNPRNNKIDNLQLSNHSDNAMNSGVRQDNTSGARGVSFEPRTGKWYARIKRQHLGTYITFEEAKDAYERACNV